MSETQDVYDLTELDSISFRCLGCRAEVILQLDRPRPAEPEQIICPLCRQVLPNARRIFERYQAVFHDVKESGSFVKLRAQKPTTQKG